MRPSILYSVFTPLSSIKGVGPKLYEHFTRLVGSHIIDLVWHFPTSIIDRRNMPAISSMQSGDIVTAVVEIQQHQAPPAHKKQVPYKIRGFNASGFITLVYFHARPEYMRSLLPEGKERVISGRVERFGGEVQIMHPDYVEPPENLAKVQSVEPIYSLTHGISRKMMRRTIEQALKNIPALPEWIDSHYLEKQQWKSWKESLIEVHHPQSGQDLSPLHPARQRLAYDECLAYQLSLKLVREHTDTIKGSAITFSGQLVKDFTAKLPFKLTDGQQKSIHEITEDQQSEKRMLRLLQGDVGSGKTVVAFTAMLNAIEAGYQSAIMAPTEILAKQHFTSIKPLADLLGMHVELLAGSIKGQQRKDTLKKLESGELHMIVGTHALFQEHVKFQRLGLVVIDEQHRFGVEQRMTLSNKGQSPDILLMSATPIPRTLTLTLYGDIDSSVLKEKPAGRKPIETRIVSHSRMDDVVGGIKRVLTQGNKAYWICPLVEESETSDLTAVEERFADLKKIFGARIELVHGRMKADQREKAMLNFRDGKADILVATTVIEVGVDVPDATVIIIEHAERFGLSQLHQLRGRVGRSNKQSSCVLMYHKLGEIGKQRLTTMRESNDGFYIAEQDLKLRGAGDIMGKRQSGFAQFRITDPFEHHELLVAAADDAKLILNRDPELKDARGKNLRTLLYLFEYEKQMEYIKTG